MNRHSTTNPPDSVLLDPAAFRMPVAVRNSEQRKKLGADLKIGKPRADDWAFVHSSKDFHFESLWAYEKDDKLYLLHPSLYDELEENVQRVFRECDFYVAAILNGDPIAWMVKHSDTEWFRSARRAVESAMTNWIQIQSNNRLKQYDVRHPEAQYPEPEWTGYTTAEDGRVVFTQLFRDKLIATPDHDVLQRIRGRK
jgi:hypothetical protein